MKLQKARFGFSTQKKYIEFDLGIKVSKDFRFFFNVDELPEQLKSLEGCPSGMNGRIYFDSFHELKSSIEDLIADAEVALVEELKAKVILYSCECGNRDGQQINFKWRVVQKLETKKHSSEHGQITNIKYFEETKTSSDYQISSRLDSLNTYSIFEDKFSEMPWSSEREAWFKEMERAIKKLAVQLETGFGAKAEVLARKIDQGAKFLLTPGGN